MTCLTTLRVGPARKASGIFRPMVRRKDPPEGAGRGRPTVSGRFARTIDLQEFLCAVGLGADSTKPRGALVRVVEDPPWWSLRRCGPADITPLHPADPLDGRSLQFPGAGSPLRTADRANSGESAMIPACDMSVGSGSSRCTAATDGARYRVAPTAWAPRPECFREAELRQGGSRCTRWY
jgi:hypothetical protein